MTPIEISSDSDDDAHGDKDLDDISETDGEQLSDDFGSDNFGSDEFGSSGSDTTDDSDPQWPGDWPTKSIVKAFRLCHKATKIRGTSVKQKFLELFPNVKYVRATFYSHRNRWIKADKSVRKKYLDLGHANAGRWKHFMKAAREHRSEIRNAKKRIRRSRA